MPNCFIFTDKQTKEIISFDDIDEKMCKELNVPIDPKLFYLGWVDNIGLSVAMGKQLGDPALKEIYKSDEKILKVIDHLEANYESDSWYQVK